MSISLRKRVLLTMAQEQKAKKTNKPAAVIAAAALGKRRHGRLSRRFIAVRWRAAFMMLEDQRPPARHWLEHSANHHAVRQHVEIVIAPLAGRAACRRAFQNEHVLAGFYHRHRFAPQPSSASRFTAGATGFLLLIQWRERPKT
jgi:hypothetical protein